jgi:hypothetical protein
MKIILIIAAGYTLISAAGIFLSMYFGKEPIDNED